MNLGMEDEYTEHKRSTSELREGMESVASILNKHGHGTLYFGVRPSDGEVIGQDVSEKTLRDISQKAGELIEPRIYPQIERLETPERKAFVRVEFSGFETPYACDGRYRIRRADEDIVMSRAKLTEMILESENRSNPWDGRSSSLQIADVDEDTLSRYVKRGVACKRIPFEYSNAEDVLSRLGLLCEDGSLTNAAAVCFVPSKDVMLKMGIFADERRVHILDNQQVTGTLFSMVDDAELYILNNTRRAFIIDGTSLHRREVPEIPMDAVREALFNAFAHRQYEDNAAIQIDIFWDHVDIYSPGLFPIGFSPESYLAGKESSSKPRNKLIATTLYRSGDIEIYGTGLQRIKAACDEQGVPVYVTQSKHGVHVAFTRSEGIAAGKSPIGNDDIHASSNEFRSGSEAVPKNSDEFPSGLSEKELSACKFIAEHGPARTAAIAEAIDMSPRGTLKLLRRLTDQGILKVTGATSNRTYALR